MDSSGAKASELRYKPYGEVRYSGLPNGTGTDYRFTGQRQLAGLGLYHMGARWVDPSLGRWLSADTLVPEPANPQSINRYSYVNNRPVRYRDPSGHWLESALDIAGIAYDIYDIKKNGLNWENGLSLAVDVGCLALPVATGGGMMVRAASKSDDAARLASHADEARWLAAHADELLKLGPRTDDFIQIAHIRGADTLLGKLLSTAADTAKGAQFELDFALQYADEIDEIGRSLPGGSEIDFVTKGNVFVNTKSYDWSKAFYQTDFGIQSVIADFSHQFALYKQYGASGVQFVFQGSVPDAVRKALEEIGAIVEVVP